ncbi:hypothetical protein [Streptomyces sp. AP-93]|uniref:hypothetical protein n=1 Tax=Streptomyces sp. AP-93 TaxID=2929048 RepID=UPI001FB00273|nr:hypothetical protein [Streptomyces sp. AP-93]MCJ0874161.1 hypothetical protein [Streptomyces sp. AP-93]
MEINEDILVTRRFADIDADIAATEAMAPPQGWDEEFDEADMAAVRAGVARALAPDARNSPA